MASPQGASVDHALWEALVARLLLLKELDQYLSLSRSRRARASRLRCLCAPCLSLRASSWRPQFLSWLRCTFSFPPCCVYSLTACNIVRRYVCPTHCFEVSKRAVKRAWNERLPWLANFLELRKAEVQLPRTIPLQQEIG